MKKKVLALLFPLTLASCSFGGSSSSSSSSYTKPPIELPKGRRIQGKGDISFAPTIKIGETVTKYNAKIEGFGMDASVSEVPSVLSDLFTPSFYEGLKMDGKAYFDSLTYGSVQGKTTQTTTIAKSEILFAMDQGDLYVDLSDVERPSELAFTKTFIPDRIKVKKPFAGVEQYDPNIPLPLTDLPSLLMGVVDFDTFERYIDIRPYDPNNLKISYVLTPESIQALVDKFVEGEEPMDIRPYLPNFEPSSVAFYYNLEETRISRLDFTLGLDLDIGTFVESLAPYFDPIHVNLSLEMPIDPVAEVTPKIEGEYGEIDMARIEEFLSRLAELAGGSSEQSSSAPATSYGGKE